jgi:hypothetical protein
MPLPDGVPQARRVLVRAHLDTCLVARSM